MSTPEIEHWMELAAMEQARKVWPGSAKLADNGSRLDIQELRELAHELAAIIARHAAPASLERELVGVLLPIVEAEETYRAGKMPKGDRIGRLTKARAVLRKIRRGEKSFAKTIDSRIHIGIPSKP